MKERLEQLRLFFPAEVTGAYLAIQGLIKVNGYTEAELTDFMAWVFLALAVCNIVIYVRVHKITSPLWHAFIAGGFAVWALNIDMARYEDFILVGPYIEIAAPTALVFYTLVTSMLEITFKGDTNV